MVWYRCVVGCVCLSLLAGAFPALAETVSGVCPDGSMFIVQSRASIPCKQARLVDPSEIPPLRPELLPQPYTWAIDQRTRDPRNPYNLLESARKIRALRTNHGIPSPTPSRTVPLVASVRPPPRQPFTLHFSATEWRDLARLLDLREQLVPATLRVDGADGRDLFAIKLAYSPAFEAELLDQLGLDRSRQHVILFGLEHSADFEFHPNFLLVQHALTFRPDPEHPEENGWLPSPAPARSPADPRLGYLVIPARFDPAQELELWWNDRSLSVVLAP